MAYKDTERTVSADIPTKLADEFDEQRSNRGQVKKDCVRAAVKLWTELSSDIQSRFLDQSTENPVFVEIVNKIVDERLALKTPAKSPRNTLHEAILHIKEMVEIERQQPGIIQRVLDNEELQVLYDLHKVLEPEKPKKTRSA